MTGDEDHTDGTERDYWDEPSELAYAKAVVGKEHQDDPAHQWYRLPSLETFKAGCSCGWVSNERDTFAVRCVLLPNPTAAEPVTDLLWRVLSTPRCELSAARSFAVAGAGQRAVAVGRSRSQPMRLLYSCAVRQLGLGVMCLAGNRGLRA